MRILEEERKRKSTVTMFISFDLVNCTLYKSKFKGKWAKSVSSVLEYIMHALIESPVDGYRFWKVLGDEVLYTKQIHDMSDVAKVLNDVYACMLSINDKIKSAEIGDEDTAEQLSTKATVWIADISPAELGADNIYVEYEINKNERKVEYLGTDIDGGFRIAKFAVSNRMIISSDLAALVWKEPSLHHLFSNIHFLAYRLLKGIWNGEAYPIFMYHPDENVTFRASLEQDTYAQTKILAEYLEQVTQRNTDVQYSSYEEQLLTEIYDTRRIKEVEQIMDIITS